MSQPVESFEIKRVQLEIPFLPPSLNLYRKAHWREQRKIQETWKEYAFVEWLRLGKPNLEAVHVTLRFLFPDRRSRDMDNYIATGSKLVGDAIKGRFIPDDDPGHLKGWSFVFSVDRLNPKTIVEIKEVSNGKDQRNCFRRGAFENLGCVQGYPGQAQEQEGIPLCGPDQDQPGVLSRGRPLLDGTEQIDSQVS